jgi:hypothetical protein
MDEAIFYAYDNMKKLIITLCVNFSYFKINFTFFIEMKRLGDDGEIEQTEIFPFRGLGMTVFREKDVTEELRRVLGDVDSNVMEFLFQGSGWSVEKPIYMEVEMVQCLPLRGQGGVADGEKGGCCLHMAKYRRFKGVIPTPLSRRDDGRCFFLAVARHFMPEGGAAQLDDFVDKRLVLDKERLNGEKEMAMAVKEIETFENANEELDIAINVVYRDEKNDVVPVYASKKIGAVNMIVMLLFHTSTEDEDGGKKEMMHYAFVDSPEKIFAQRNLGSWGVLRTNNIYVCFNCFNQIRSEGAYRNHVSFCHQNKCQKIKLPEEGETLSFDERCKTDSRTFKTAFMLFFDFEALQVEPEKPCSCPEEMIRARREWEGMDDDEKAERIIEQHMLEGELTAEWEYRKHLARERGRRPPARPKQMPRKQKMAKMCTHKSHVVKNQPPFCYSLVLVDRDGRVREEKTYVGEDAPDNFITTVLNLSDKYLPSLSPGIPMELMTVQEKRTLLLTQNCYLCEEEMMPSDKVLDHDHLNGDFLGVAHNRCNLARREQLKLTCFAHNFSGYDSHFLIRAINKQPERVTNINAIPLNTQKFKSITLNYRIRFVDSCQFLTDSLSNLVDTLKASNCQFNILKQMAETEEEKELLLRKGVYPYSYATSEQRLRETVSLPPRKLFWNDLREEECSEEDYQHAQKVWEVFSPDNMMDYTALYVKTDVFLLAEVMLDFRNLVWSNFNLDICHYLSLPHLAKDIMLKYTGAEIELIADQEMNNLLQKNIRGGLSYVNVRHAEKITSDSLEERKKREEEEEEEEGWKKIKRRRRKKKKGKEPPRKEKPQSMMYVDANNLYGLAMMYPLPLRGFRWMASEEIENFDPLQQCVTQNGPGYILEVDLEYPEHLHLPHNSYPLAPETMDLCWGDLSPYSQECLRTLGTGGSNYRSRKLTSTFRKRYEQSFIYSSLQTALHKK